MAAAILPLPVASIASPAIPDDRVAATLLEITADAALVLNAERATLFLYAPETDELWSLASVGGRQTEIRIKADTGVAGHVMRTGEPALILDPYGDPRFNREVDRRSGFVTRQILCRPLTTMAGERIGVLQVLNRKDGPFDSRDDRVLQAVAAQAATSLENARLFERVLALHESEQALLRQLEDQHRQLQDAFLLEESTKKQLALRLRGRTVRRVFIALGLLVALTGLGYAAQARFGLVELGRALAGVQGNTAASTPGGEAAHDLVRAATRPVQDWSRLVGRLEPLAWVAVVSPIDSVVVSLEARHGQLVEKGQILARLGTAEHEQKLRDADTALILALEEAERLRNWERSIEVARTRRDVAVAESALAAARREADETGRLYQAGIVARTELDYLQRSLAGQENALLAAREALAATLDQGSAEKLRVAELKLQNAQAQFDQVRADVDRAVIRSPATGILFPATEAQADAASPVRREAVSVGAAVSRSTPLFAIADMTGVAVDALVVEEELLALRVGQEARITIDAAPGVELEAEIASIAGRAAAQGGQGQGAGAGPTGPARFEVSMIVRELTPAQRDVLRIGMTATAHVLTYDNPDALVVPFEAIEVAGDERFVRVQEPGSGMVRREVRIRTTLLDGVEIASGLEPGEMLVVRP